MDMRLNSIVILLIGVCSIISCEKDADASDFVSQDLFEEAIGAIDDAGSNDGDNEIPINRIPSESNPIIIGEFNGVEFEAINYQGIETLIDENSSLLTLAFTDANGNELVIEIINPETREYTFEENQEATFKVDFFEAATGRSFNNVQRDGANSNSGTLLLIYNVDSDSTTVSASFNFVAFLETTGRSDEFIDFIFGNLESLPIEQ